MILVRGASDKIKVVYELQSEVTVRTTHWYNNDAEDIIYLERDSNDVITAYVPTTARTGLVVDISDGQARGVLALGEGGLYDCFRRKLVFSSTKKKYTEGLFSFAPQRTKAGGAFYSYMCGSTDGTIRFMFGSNEDLHLAWFVQSRTWMMRDTGAEQTPYGRALVAGLFLERYGLPRFSKKFRPLKENFLSTKEDVDELPEGCFDFLSSISTAEIPAPETQLLLPGSVLEAITEVIEEAEDKEGDNMYVDLDFILEIGIESFANELVFPLDVDFSKNTELDLALVSSISFTSKTEITVDMVSYDEKVVEVLQQLLSEYDLRFRSGTTVYHYQRDSDLDDMPEDWYLQGGLE